MILVALSCDFGSIIVSFVVVTSALQSHNSWFYNVVA